MLFGASLYVKSIAQEMKSKVGIYFYIKDDPLLKDKIMTSVLNIRDELTKEGIEVQFQSKDQAMKFLENRLPDVVKNFEKYDIENPLPPALYISLRDQSDYDRVKMVLTQHKHIIAEGELDNKEQSLKSQEVLALKALRLSDLVIWATYALMSVLCGIIFVFLMFIIYVTFHKHLPQIQIYKLLGASYREMMTPYILYMLCFLGVGFVIFVLGALAL
jgi:cell division protein FtsX